MFYLTTLIDALACNSFVRLCFLAMTLDVFLGVFASIKKKKTVTTIGIDGIVRKASMLVCVIVFMIADLIMNFNVVFMIPDDYLKVIGLEKVGLCEFFSILFICFELLSCCKNARRINMPLPKKVNDFLYKLLTEFTEEGE